MEQRQQFSPGLLYSVPPEDIFTLHLQEEEGWDEFDWSENESRFSAGAISQAVLSFLKKTAIAWGLVNAKQDSSETSIRH